jgi:hypothetical protein
LFWAYLYGPVEMLPSGVRKNGELGSSSHAGRSEYEVLEKLYRSFL